MQDCQCSMLPYELIAQCLNELSLSDQLTNRLVCKQFHHLINNLEVHGQLVNCKVKDYVPTVKKLIPHFIRQIFNVGEFTKITTLFISSKDASEASSIETQCHGKIVVGHLNEKDFFFTFPCQQIFMNRTYFRTLVFYSVNAFWHFAAFDQSNETSDFFPLRCDVETYGENSRYFQYGEMLTQIFQMKVWPQFSRLSNRPSDSCVMTLSPHLLDQLKK